MFRYGIHLQHVSAGWSVEIPPESLSSIAVGAIGAVITLHVANLSAYVTRQMSTALLEVIELKTRVDTYLTAVGLTRYSHGEFEYLIAENKTCSLICSDEYFFSTEFIIGFKKVSRKSIDEVFLPDKEDCLKYLREHRWSDEVTSPHCGSADTIKKGTTRKGVQRYRCHHCDSIFNDLIETIFSGHQLSIPEMFYIIREMKESTTERTVQELDRTYKTVLDFVHEVQDALDDDPEFDLIGVCEVDESENRHIFLCNWLRRFRGVSKHHLQGYLNFFSLTLNTDHWFEEILSTYFYI